MYLFGVFLIGFGIVFLIMGVVALSTADSSLVAGLICIGCFSVPMLVSGIWLVRRAESRRQGETVSQAPPATAIQPGLIGILQRAQALNLSQLNWVGWLVLLATFIFVLAEAFALTSIWRDITLVHQLKRLIALTMLFLAIGFFAGIRWILKKIGISIYLPEYDSTLADASARLDPSPADDAPERNQSSAPSSASASGTEANPPRIPGSP
ncbi:MAG: hypothetical protein NZU63_13410 [Gemmataceae bacterium]|nr:hypothetical protein [Gemmataceae bacterium]MDW8244166.1 hypothetical protein [Thermogemmata sp.]